MSKSMPISTVQGHGQRRRRPAPSYSSTSRVTSMGQGGGKRRRRPPAQNSTDGIAELQRPPRRRHPFLSVPSTPKGKPRAADSSVDGVIMVLFETPSGFAVFYSHETYLYEPNAIEGMCCLFDEPVMEVIWGLKNLIHSLVPQEKSKLAKEDSLQMSKGLNLLLNRYGFDVKPEMVNKDIIEMACMLNDCDFCLKKHAKALRLASDHLLEVSCINSQDWDVMKLATALKIVCYPDERIVLGNPREMSKLVTDAVAQKYDGRILKATVKRVYDELVFAYEVGHEICL
ncbi:hypothetical protein ACP70R_037404 [Stipagrostis hirtigluma subsp. patula]